MTNLCPACEVGILAARVRDRVINFEGSSLRVENLHYSECPSCGERVVLPSQSKRNAIIYADAKKKYLGLWTCGKIDAFRKEWNLTLNQASKIFGGGANAFSKYSRGEVIHSKSMDLLMRVFDESDEARALLAEYAGITLATHSRWRTLLLGPAPKHRAGTGPAVMRSGVASLRPLTSGAANGDRWQTSDVING